MLKAGVGGGHVKAKVGQVVVKYKRAGMVVEYGGLIRGAKPDAGTFAVIV